MATWHPEVGETCTTIGVLLGEIDGFPWWMLQPPGKPGIAIHFSTKTTKKNTLWVPLAALRKSPQVPNYVAARRRNRTGLPLGRDFRQSTRRRSTHVNTKSGAFHVSSFILVPVNKAVPNKLAFDKTKRHMLLMIVRSPFAHQGKPWNMNSRAPF